MKTQVYLSLSGLLASCRAVTSGTPRSMTPMCSQKSALGHPVAAALFPSPAQTLFGDVQCP